MYDIPLDVIGSLFCSLAEILGEDGAYHLFQEQWLVDLRDRWVTFASALPREFGGPALPSVLPQFRRLLFGITRCAMSNSKVPFNFARSDAQHLQTLDQLGLTRVAASGENNNCLIHSLSIALAALGYITVPANPRDAFEDIRGYLIRTDGLHPLEADGQKSERAYLEHGIRADAVVRQLHQAFGSKALPDGGIQIWVHARYDVQGQSPPDFIIAGEAVGSLPGAVADGDVINLFNWTGGGCSGYHYDALLVRESM